MELDSAGNIRMIWETQFYHTRPGGLIEVTVSQAHLTLRPDLTPLIEAYGNSATPYLPGIEFKWTYPTGMENIAINPSASLAGAVTVLATSRISKKVCSLN